MTSGTPWKLILRFYFPILACGFFQQLYNLADTVVVGRFVGTEALAAVGAAGPIVLIFLNFMFGVATGCCIPVSAAFGAGDRRKMRCLAANSLYAAGAAGLVFTALSLLLLDPLLRFMNTPAGIVADCRVYLVWLFGGMLTSTYYNLAAGLLRAVGDSRTPSVCLFYAAALNVGLNVFFVVSLKMGVSGVAVATVISQAFCVAYCAAHILRKTKELVPAGDEWRPDAALLKELLLTGLPVGFQYSIPFIGSVVAQSVYNKMGAEVIAAMTAAEKVHTLGVMVFQMSLGTALSTYCAQNLGAGKLERIRAGIRQSAVIVAVLTAVLGTAFYFFGRRAAGLFLAPDAAGRDAILDYAEYYIHIAVWFQAPLCAIFLLRSSIQGMGYTTLALFGGVMELIARSAVALLLEKPCGFAGVCLANPAAWLLAGTFFTAAYAAIIGKLERTGLRQRT